MLILATALADADLAALLRTRPAVEVQLALESVTTRRGAERIYRSERQGRARVAVLRTAARRIAQLGGTERDGNRSELIIAGRGVEAPRRSSVTTRRM